jgi:hypothetical protein
MDPTASPSSGADVVLFCRLEYTHMILDSIAVQEERLGPQPDTSAIRELRDKYQRSQKTLKDLLAYKLMETPEVDRATSTEVWRPSPKETPRYDVSLSLHIRHGISTRIRSP